MHRLNKHVSLRKAQTAATSARAAALGQLKQQRMPPLERVDGTTGAAKPQQHSWGSEAGIRAIVEAAGARLWDMPRDGDCAFHMYAR